MDIYSFIKSKDIAEHCRTIGYKFTPLEMAVIIYHSKKPLTERHKAWHNIIDTQPDTKVIEWTQAKRERMPFDSLHQYLKDYMTIENNLADKLKTKEPDAVYTYEDGGFYHDNMLYSTYQAVTKAIKEQSEAEKNRTFYVYKRFLDMEKYLSVQVTSDGEVISNWDWSKGVLSKADYDLFTSLDFVSIYIPIPFRKGDILTYCDNRPFVLTDNEWKYGKEKSLEVRQYLAVGSIMDSIHGYSIRGNYVYWDFNPATLELEYYRSELTGMSRVLKAISNYIKGEISTDLMINAYDIILREERLKDLRASMHYTDEGLSLAGLDGKGN